jgi:crotonobetainyl-CoA:carnitine CoA-transferase CaiB-like acyl-CoA transferase
MLANQASNYLVSGRAPGRGGNAHPNIVPYQDFPTLDGRIAVAVGNDGQFAAFARALERADWVQDPRFQTNAGRVEHREILIAQIIVVMSARSSAHWTQALNKAGVPCGPIQSIDQVFAHPQAQARGLSFDLPMTGSGAAPLVASPMRLSGTPPVYRSAPPRLGEHTRQVLQERLGIDQKACFDLQQGGIVR